MVRTLVSILILTPVILACDDDSVVGSGKTETETRKLATFDEIEFRVPGDFEVKVGSQSPLRIKADDNILPLIKTEVRDGRLIVSAEQSYTSKHGAKFYVTVADLSAVKLKGTGDMNVHGLDNKKFSLTAEGTADVKLSGKTSAFQLSIDGTADVSAFSLSADAVSVSISGSGDAEVNAGDSLNVSIKGTGDVTYSGKPTVTQAIMGTGDVTRKR